MFVFQLMIMKQTKKIIWSKKNKQKVETNKRNNVEEEEEEQEGDQEGWNKQK